MALAWRQHQQGGDLPRSQDLLGSVPQLTLRTRAQHGDELAHVPRSRDVLPSSDLGEQARGTEESIGGEELALFAAGQEVADAPPCDAAVQRAADEALPLLRREVPAITPSHSSLPSTSMCGDHRKRCSAREKRAGEESPRQ